MTTTDNHWKLLTKEFNPNLKEILNQQYFGSQFIAMAGRYLIKQRDDDSNTSMVFDSERQSFIGETLPGNIRTQLNLSDLSLALLREDSLVQPAIPLPGHDMNEVLNRLIQAYDNVGIIGGNLKDEMHYELPEHDLMHGSEFSYGPPELISENIAYRHNAETILNGIISSFKHSDAVRIWPHHFDIGTFIPLEYDSKNELARSVGLGWAIPDGMVNEPYFYLSIWSKEPFDFPARMEPLKAGNWMMPGWNGAVLKLSEILNYQSANEQHECASSFFKSGIQIIQDLINS